MIQILLIEDDDRLSQLITDFLQQNQMQVTRLRDGENLLAQLQQQTPHVLILDVMLPGEDGFSLCRKIRPVYQGPLLFLTAREESFDQIFGLELGADDYIIKPAEPRVLLARINALLRRS